MFSKAAIPINSSPELHSHWSISSLELSILDDSANLCGMKWYLIVLHISLINNEIHHTFIYSLWNVCSFIDHFIHWDTTIFLIFFTYIEVELADKIVTYLKYTI